VFDAEFIEVMHPPHELCSVLAAEGDVIEADPELAEPLVGRRPGVLMQADERAVDQVHGVVEIAVRVLVDHGLGIEERSVPRDADRKIPDRQRHVDERWKRLHVVKSFL
jgi:hypothetical protein